MSAQPATGEQMPSILVVDDNEHIRAMLTLQLSAAGYDVVSAADGVQALESLRTSAPRLLITDMVMPEMEGTLLIREARRLHPELRIIAISGSASLRGPAEVYLGVAECLGADRTFGKPFHPEELLAAVTDLLTVSD